MRTVCRGGAHACASFVLGLFALLSGGCVKCLTAGFGLQGRWSHPALGFTVVVPLEVDSVAEQGEQSDGVAVSPARGKAWFVDASSSLMIPIGVGEVLTEFSVGMGRGSFYWYGKDSAHGFLYHSPGTDELHKRQFWWGSAAGLSFVNECGGTDGCGRVGVYGSVGFCNRYWGGLLLRGTLVPDALGGVDRRLSGVTISYSLPIEDWWDVAEVIVLLLVIPLAGS